MNKPLNNNDSTSFLESPKVLFVLPETLTFGGGGETFALLLKAYLKKKRVNVVVSENVHKYQRETKSVTEHSQIYTDASVIRPEYLFYGHIHMPFFTQPFPSVKVLSRFDHNFLFCYRIPTRKFIADIKRLGLNVTFLFHGVTFETFSIRNINAWLFSQANKLLLLFISRLINNSKIDIQVLNGYTKEVLTALGIEEKRISLVRLALEGRTFQPVRNDEVFLIAFLSRLENRQKGIRRLVKLIRLLDKESLSNLRITLMGTGSSERMLRKKLINIRCVEILGKVDEVTKSKILSCSSLFLSTSNIEPFGLSILEGLYFGLPCLTTPTSGPSYILSHDSSLGRISSFRSKSMVSDLVSFYNEWKDNKNDYFQKRLNISCKAGRLFTTEPMLLESSKNLKLLEGE